MLPPYLEGQFHEVFPLEGSVGAGHGNHLRLLHQEIVDAVTRTTQQLKRTELLQLLEDLAQVAETSLQSTTQQLLAAQMMLHKHVQCPTVI